MPTTAVSNSYLKTIEEADTFFACRLGAAAWTGNDKAKALQQATTAIDQLPLRGQRYELPYIEGGSQKDTDEDGLAQVLEFPRVIDGVVCDWDFGTQKPIVPRAVLDACCLEALALLELQANPDKLERLSLQRQGVTSASYSGTSEQYVTNPSGGISGAGDRYHGLISFEAYRLLRKYVGVRLR